MTSGRSRSISAPRFPFSAPPTSSGACGGRSVTRSPPTSDASVVKAGFVPKLTFRTITPELLRHRSRRDRHADPARTCPLRRLRLPHRQHRLLHRRQQDSATAGGCWRGLDASSSTRPARSRIRDTSCVGDALETVEKVQPKKTYLTHMSCTISITRQFQPPSAGRRRTGVRRAAVSILRASYGRRFLDSSIRTSGQHGQEHVLDARWKRSVMRSDGRLSSANSSGSISENRGRCTSRRHEKTTLLRVAESTRWPRPAEGHADDADLRKGGMEAFTRGEIAFPIVAGGRGPGSASIIRRGCSRSAPSRSADALPDPCRECWLSAAASAVTFRC